MPQSVKISAVSGVLQVPASKSMMQRVCAAALLHKGETIVHNYGSSEDDKAALDIIRQLGATVEVEDNLMTIRSSGALHDTHIINCGESGLSARLFTPVAALSAHKIQVNGSGSLLRRPMQLFGEVLPQLGVALENFKGYIPFSVQGPLRPEVITLDGSLSSQFISGLLFAYTAAATERVTLQVSNLTSKPYIDLTLEVLARFGKPVRHERYEHFIIDPALFAPAGLVHISVEGDWSSAAFWIAAAAISGSIRLHGLNPDSMQADRVLVDLVTACGANVAWADDVLEINSAPLQAFSLDATHCPDLFPVVAVLAACCSGTSHISGLHRLTHKESDRAKSISDMLHALGVTHQVAADTLHITGMPVFHPATIDGHNDHRIVMAAALAALRTDGAIAITDTHAVHKSYPQFFTDLLKHTQ